MKLLFFTWIGIEVISHLLTHSYVLLYLHTLNYYHDLSLSLSSIFEHPLQKKYEQDGEQVEFEVIEEPNGRFKAYNVTGPDGSYVQGAPKRFRNNEYGHDESGGY